MFSWFQRGCGFKRRRRHLCYCIPNFPNPQLASSIWTNTFYNLEKYISTIWTNTFYNLNKPMSPLLLLHSKLSKSTACLLHVNKYILQFGKRFFTIWTNTFYNLNKYFYDQCFHLCWCIPNFPNPHQLAVSSCIKEKVGSNLLPVPSSWCHCQHNFNFFAIFLLSICWAVTGNYIEVDLKEENILMQILFPTLWCSYSQALWSWRRPTWIVLKIYQLFPGQGH